MPRRKVTTEKTAAVSEAIPQQAPSLVPGQHVAASAQTVALDIV